MEGVEVVEDHSPRSLTHELKRDIVLLENTLNVVYERVVWCHDRLVVTTKPHRLRHRGHFLWIAHADLFQVGNRSLRQGVHEVFKRGLHAAFSEDFPLDLKRLSKLGLHVVECTLEPRLIRRADDLLEFAHDEPHGVLRLIAEESRDLTHHVRDTHPVDARRYGSAQAVLLVCVFDFIKEGICVLGGQGTISHVPTFPEVGLDLDSIRRRSVLCGLF